MLSLCGLLFGQQKVKVKYLSAEHVYIDAGSKQGVQVGDRLAVTRSGEKIATIEVVYVSRYSASCKLLEGGAAVQAGDTIELLHKKTAGREQAVQAAEEKQPVEKKSAPLPLKPGRKKRSGVSRLSGYLSVQWYQFMDQSDRNYTFRQPGGRAKLKLRNIVGSGLDFRFKMRSRYNSRQRRFNGDVPRNEWRNRIYQISLSYENRQAPVNFQAGRIISNAFSGVGYIDGLLLQHNISRSWHWGMFAGNQPEWQYSRFSGSLQKYGGFLQFEQGDYRKNRYEFTLAGAGEYHGKTVSREFLYLQNVMNFGPGWSFYQNMEVDVNRSWRRERTGQKLSLSSFYLNGRYQFSSNASVGLSYDNRKNYYTWEMQSLADSLFDAAFRQGLRANANFSLPNYWYFHANLGWRTRQNDGRDTWSWTASLRKRHFLRRGTSLSARVSGFNNTWTRGLNPSFSLSQYIHGGHQLRLSYGMYSYSLHGAARTRSNQWLRANARLQLPLNMFLSADYEYDWGDEMAGQRVLAELGYRF